jgi:hypothetical protein
MESLDLTPAESLIITSPDSNGTEMIKLTLMDLILKKALNVNMEYFESRFSKNNYKTTFISINKSYKSDFKPHEEILMRIIDNNELELKEFIKTLFKRLTSSDYKNIYVRGHLVDKGYLIKQRKMLLALLPYNTYVLTDKGVELKSMIMELLNEAKYLDKWIKEDLGRAKAYLSVMGSHILLTKTYDIEDIKKFNRMLSYIKPAAKTSDYYYYYMYTVPVDFLDDQGDPKSFDFLDISLLDNFDSFGDFFSDFDAGSGDGCCRRDSEGKSN